MDYGVASLQDSSVILVSWYLCPSCVPFLQRIMAGLCDQHNTVEVTYVTSKAESKRDGSCYLGLPLGSLALRKAAAMSR